MFIVPLLSLLLQFFLPSPPTPSPTFLLRKTEIILALTDGTSSGRHEEVDVLNPMVSRAEHELRPGRSKSRVSALVEMGGKCNLIAPISLLQLLQ